MFYFRNSLTARFILLIALIVTGSSIVFAGALVSIKNRLEEATFGDMVRDQLNVIMSTGHDHSDLALLSNWEFYGAEDSSRIPPSIQSLPPGSHHSVRVDDAYYQVEKAVADGQPVVLVYDISDWEAQEHALLRWLLYGAVTVLLASVLLAWLATRAGLRPLYALTEKLATITPDNRQVKIAAYFQGHEVGLIAREFDRYQHRLDQFVDREKFFSAAASHELRTPLSVIIGAVDVLEASQTENASSKPLQRIRRACMEMLAFIEATLFLTREDYQFNDDGGITDVASVVRQSLADSQQQIADREIRIDYQPSHTLEVSERPSIIKMVVGNILKNAVEHTREGTIVIKQDDRCLTISDSGEGITESNLERVFERSYTTKPGGTGLGLTLVKKICDRLNWGITISSAAGEGTQVQLDFKNFAGNGDSDNLIT